MTHAGMISVPEKRLIRQLVAVGDFHSNCIIITGEVVSLQKQSFSPGSTNLKGHSVIGVGVGEGGTFLLVKDKCLKDHKDCQWDHLNERVHHLAVDRRMAERVLHSHTDIKVHVVWCVIVSTNIIIFAYCTGLVTLHPLRCFIHTQNGGDSSFPPLTHL